jgi:2'-5' RNA ligase
MFVAAWPDDGTLRRLTQLELGPAEGLRVVGPGQWHVTLRFLGPVDGGRVPALVDALRVAAGELPDSLPCRAGPGTAWFSGNRVLQIPVSGLEGAAGAVRSATRSVVPDPIHGEAPFTGHLTVARSKRGGLDASARRGLAGIPFASPFEVHCFDLVESQLSPEGPRYTTVARVPLRG